MIPLPERNAMCRPYRGLSVQDVEMDLGDEGAISRHLLGREVYRRTHWLLLRSGAQLALVEVRKASSEPVFSPVTEARVLAGPDRTVWVDDPGADVGNASSLAQAVAHLCQPHVDAYAVRGRYEHVNVIWRPTPVRVLVTEVVPPQPAKLHEMARQALAFDEDLPPVELVLDAVDISDLARAHPREAYLLPCRGCGADLPGEVAFLDTRPHESLDWLLIGCERSQEFHRHFYGREAAQVDLCPSRRANATLCDSGAVLTKCCLLERGVELHGDVAVVPWGSTLDEVRLALRLLTGVGPLPEPAQVGTAGIG